MDEQKVLIDALPYYDKGYDEPGVREAALAQIEAETQSYRPTKNYLEHLPAPNLDSFLTDIMQSEFERIQARQPLEPLSMKRYELPGPPEGKKTDVGAWQEALENTQAQLEHQAVRLENLHLMQEYGGHMWRTLNNTIDKMVEVAQKELAIIRKQIQEINWQRKNEQLEAGEKLKALEETWVGLITKNYEIDIACHFMESQLKDAGIDIDIINNGVDSH